MVLHKFNNVYIRYGNLIQIILEFLIIAFSIYIILYIFIKRKEQEQNLLLKKKARLEKIRSLKKILQNQHQNQKIFNC